MFGAAYSKNTYNPAREIKRALQFFVLFFVSFFFTISELNAREPTVPSLMG